MSEPMPGAGRVDSPAEVSEADGFAVRIVFESTDVGADRAEAVRWLSEWMEAALQDAPFHVERIYAYAVSNVEVLDV